MGIYDREYYREDTGGGWLSQRTMVTNLILLNVAVFLADWLGGLQLDSRAGMYPSNLLQPWMWWRLLTYGFVHDVNNLQHVAFNMFGLWLFGRDVEGIYGRWEFLRVYLTVIIMSGLVFAAVQLLRGGPDVPIVGASGGVMGIMILYVMHFPRRVFYIWALIPVPAWALGLIYVLVDISGTLNPAVDDNTAHVAHLAGVAFGFIYYKSGWNLGRLIPAGLSRKLRPTLRVHDPSDTPEPDYRDLNKVVDEILEKISREGEASLTKKERQTLEDASRRYQRRRS
jgi:membrane associated rhomboid family serine protease